MAHPDKTFLLIRALSLVSDYDHFWASTFFKIETGLELADVLAENALLDAPVPAPFRNASPSSRRPSVEVNDVEDRP
jgi:hypothetical protein